MADDRMLMLDVSHYDSVDWAKVDPRVRVVCAKADVKAQEHIAAARASGRIAGAYAWADPTRTVASVMGDVAAALGSVRPSFLWIDSEQHWADWAEWYRWRRREISSITRILSGKSIKLHTEGLWGALVAKYPGVPIACYTRVTWLDKYTPELREWLRGRDVCLAEWTEGAAAGGLRVEWGALPLPAGRPLRLVPGARLVYWQWSGERYIPPGMSKVSDIGYTMMGADAFASYIGGEVQNGESWQQAITRWARNLPAPYTYTGPDPE